MVRVFMLTRLPLFSQGVETLLCREQGVEIVGRGTDIETCLAQIEELAPDVVILDTAMQQGDIISIATSTLAKKTKTRVVALSLKDNTISVFHGEQRTVHCIEDLMKAIANEANDSKIPKLN